MKKIFAVLLMLSLLLTACTPSGESNTDQATTTSVSTQAEVPTTTQETTTNDSEQLTCPNCNAALEPDSVFCSQCGAKIDEEGNVIVEDYDPTQLVENIDDYVGIVDVNYLPGDLPAGLELLDDIRPQDFTLNLKQRYRNNSYDAIRLPYLKMHGDLAADINRQILNLLNDYSTENWNIDYDAYIYHDVLSIIIKFDYDIVKTFNLDISDDELKLLSSDELFAKIGAKRATVEAFLKNYLTQELDNYHFLTEISDFDQHQLRIDSALTGLINTFNEQYDNDELAIYKAIRNNSYSVELIYYDEQYEENYKFNFTLADDIFEMALLSAPWNALGFYYRAGGEGEIEIPPRDANNNEVQLHVLNEDIAYPIYIVPFATKDNYIELADFNFTEVPLNDDEIIFVRGLTGKDIVMPQTDKADIYLYHTPLPETIPWEAICINNEFLSSMAQIAITEDMKDGYPIEFIYGRGYIVDYFSYDSNFDIRLSLKSKREFSAQGDWQAQGMPITSGTYSGDDSYFYLFPSEEDVAAGAEKFYIFKWLNHNELELIYGSESGPLQLGTVLSPTPIDMMTEPYY